MTTISRLFSCLFLAALFMGCPGNDDDLTPALNVPTDYTFERGGTSTVSFSGQTERIGMASELAGAMTDFDRTVEDLSNLFRNPEGLDPFADATLNASSKSVRSKVAASRDLFFANTTAGTAIKTQMDEWIAAQVAEVFPAQNELAAAGQAGQIADGSAVRYVNAWGLEYNQAVAKSLIGALMYDQIANNYLSPAVLDEADNRSNNDIGITADGKPYTTMEHKWDEAFGYLFGASASPASPLADLGADDFLNKYLSRVEDDPDYAGIAATIEEDFRRGRAAIVAGDYTARDQAADRITEELGKVIAIRAIYYLKQGEAALRATPANFGTAFHDLSEGYGFIYSLRFVPTTPYAADADRVDDYLTTLRNAGGQGFWDIDPDALATMAADIATATGISLEAAGN